jgi:hypothetical protein
MDAIAGGLAFGATRMDAVSARSPSVWMIAGIYLALFSPGSHVHAQLIGAAPNSVTTPNFVVFANNPQWAQQVSEAAEANRKTLAMHWLGYELPQWSKRCTLVVHDGPSKPANGETKYTLIQGAVINFQMTVVGTRERILDSVLPHEITHTIIASHFAPLGKPVPRWADEGMCTTVEHDAERRKHDEMLVRFLRQGKGIPFATLFLLREYPPDMLPLYSQGYSLTSFLIAQGGSQTGAKQFIKFLEKGMEKEDWIAATEEVYGYPSVGKLQTAWNNWVVEGGGEVTRFTAQSLGFSDRSLVALASSRTLGAAPISVEPSIASTRPESDSTSAAPAFASAVKPSVNLNKSLHPSTGSYYLDRLRTQQGMETRSDAGSEPIAATPSESSTNVPPPGRFVPTTTTEIVGSTAAPYRAGHPAPMQTMGGGTLYR